MRTWLASLYIVLGAVGCAGTESGNPSLTGQLALNAHSSAPAVVALRSPGGEIAVSEVWLSLGQVGLLQAGDCPAGDPVAESAAIGTGDHAGPEPLITSLEVPEGDYCGLVQRFVRASEPLPPGAPADLAGRSILIVATLADGTPLRFAVDVQADVPAFAVRESFHLGPDNAAMLLGFDLARWLGDLDFSSAERQADGSIVVDDVDNVALAEELIARLSSGIELYRDRDGDGALDAEPELLARGEP